MDKVLPVLLDFPFFKFADESSAGAFSDVDTFNDKFLSIFNLIMMINNKRLREEDNAECSTVVDLHQKLVSVKKSDVPAYLQTSEFYLSLNDEDGDILVPDNCLKFDDSINNNEDLRSLLLALRFWVALNISKSVLDYTFSQPSESYESILSEFYNELPLLQSIVTVVNAPDGKRMDQAISAGAFSVADYLYEYRGIAWPEDSSVEAAQSGNLTWLKRAMAAGVQLKLAATHVAGQHGHLDYLKFLHENGCPWDEKTCEAALGHLDCLRYLHENGCPWNENPADWSTGHINHMHFAKWHNICTRAAYKGSVDALKYVHSQGVPLQRDALVIAALYGNLECMKYILSQGIPLSADVSRAAIASDRLEHVKYLHELGCPWHENACFVAAVYSSLDCLVYLHEQGCPWNEKVCSEAVCRGRSDIVAYLIRHGCPVSDDICWDWTTESAFLEVVTAFVEMQLPWTLIPDATMRAAEYQHINGLKYLVEHGCPVHPRCAKYAAKNGRLDFLEYLLEHNFAFDAQIPACDRSSMLEALIHGHLQCAEFLHRHGCPVPHTACYEILKGHFQSRVDVQCFAFAHTRGECLLTPDLTEKAARGGYLDLLKYLHEQGCEWSSKAALAAAQNGHAACLEYMLSHGCNPGKEFTRQSVMSAIGMNQEQCLEIAQKYGLIV